VGLVLHAGGCARDTSVARSFELGRQAAAYEGVRIGLEGVKWDDAGITLRLEFVALDRPLVLPMRGVVFVLEGLVYPLVPVAGEPWPALDEQGQPVLRVSPGMSARVVGRVELGRALPTPGVLSVRGLSSPLGDAGATRLELEVPATPTGAAPKTGAS